MTKQRPSLTQLIEDAVDKGATTAEEIHRSIADFPLRLIEESELLREPAKEVRRLQDRIIGAIYDLVRDTNRRIARLAANLLGRQPKQAAHATGGAS